MIQACETCGLQYDVSSYNEGTRVRCKCKHILVVGPHRAATVSCASCGAHVRGDVATCPYCHGSVKRAVCPECFRGLREDARFCDSCGATIRAEVVHTPEATDRACPRCESALFHVQLEGYALDQCGGCGGLWVDRRTVEAIVRDQPKAVETGVRPDTCSGSTDQAALLTGEFKGRAYIPCPVCTKIMNPQNYARFSGVIIDLCRQHGIWFDAGELNRVLEFVSEGGLVEARKKEAEQAKDDASRARMDAASAKMASARVGGDNPYAHAHGQPSTLLVSALVEGVFGLFGK